MRSTGVPQSGRITAASRRRHRRRRESSSSAARSAARIASACANRRPIGVQRPRRDRGLLERGGPRLRTLVAVPAAVRPLERDEPFDPLGGSLVRKTEPHRRPDGIPFLRGASTDALGLVRVDRGPRRTQVGTVRQVAVHLALDRQQRRITRRIVDLGEAHQRPVRPLELRVGVQRDRAVGGASGQQRPGTRRIGDRGAKRRDCRLRLVDTQGTHPGLVGDDDVVGCGEPQGNLERSGTLQHS